VRDLSFSSGDIERIVCNNLEKKEVKKVLNKLNKKKDCIKGSEEVAIREKKSINKTSIKMDIGEDLKAIVGKELSVAMENLGEIIEEEKEKFKSEIEEEIKQIIDNFSLNIVSKIEEEKEEIKGKIEELANDAVDKIEEDLNSMGRQVSCDDARDKIIDIIEDKTKELKDEAIEEIKRGVEEVESIAKKEVEDLKKEVEEKADILKEEIKNRVINIKESVTTNIKIEEIIKRNLEQIEKLADVTNLLEEIGLGIEQIKESWVFRETEFLGKFLEYLEGEADLFLRENIGVDSVEEFRENLNKDYETIKDIVNKEKEND